MNYQEDEIHHVDIQPKIEIPDITFNLGYLFACTPMLDNPNSIIGINELINKNIEKSRN